MAFDNQIRNKLARLVSDARKLLTGEFTKQMQEIYGIQPDGTVILLEKLTYLTDEQMSVASVLRDRVEHLASGLIAEKNPSSAAIERMTREASFTILNRFAALRMCEERGIVKECIRNGMLSKGFQVYLKVAGSGLGDQYERYKAFLFCVFDEIAVDLGILFDRFSPYGLLFPREPALKELLDFINNPELKTVWSEDETIGWVYQYFNPPEERRAMREASQAPRNSRELAVRNQFFTPRYVVEFLTDNTLGRIWYEMRKGETLLKERCRYLVRRPSEILLKEGEEPPAESKNAREDLSQEELLKQPVYIPHRPKKDPREIKVLDPACGSGHFLLYCFDLLQVIYEEVYDDPNLGAALRRDYPAIEGLRRAVPGLILKHNLHGIDIDLRATQIAALALWLRCQRVYQELGLKNGERPKITRSNIVCAEPMPGETDLLKEFTDILQPKVLGQLVEAVFEKMKLAGEAGSLLKIEEEIRDAAMTAKKEYQEELRRQQEQVGYLRGMAPPRERTLFDFSDMTDSEFLDRAEEEIIAALRQYAEQASNGRGFRRRLFADDAARGFAFVDVCRSKYNVVLMNPPFGALSSGMNTYACSKYPDINKNILCAFWSRTLNLINKEGLIGAIFDRTASIKTSYQAFRKRYFLADGWLYTGADLGWEVLDANVEATCSILSKKPPKDEMPFFDVLSTEKDGKEHKLHSIIGAFNGGRVVEGSFLMNPEQFLRLPNYVIGFQVPRFVVHLFNNSDTLESAGCVPFKGHDFKADEHFKLFWEIT